MVRLSKNRLVTSQFLLYRTILDSEMFCKNRLGATRWFLGLGNFLKKVLHFVDGPRSRFDIWDYPWASYFDIDTYNKLALFEVRQKSDR